jgi:hypothetical protein
MLPHDIPNLPWVKIGSDIFQHGSKYFLILVDYFSNFIEVCPIKNIGSKAVIEAMKEQFARHGIPWVLVSDNGPAYASKEFADFKKQWEFDHITSSPNYAQSNGRSEKSVRTIKDILIKSINSGTDFYLGLLNFRTTPRDNISSPSQLLMGRMLNTRLPSHEIKLRPSRDNTLDYENMVRNQQASKQNYDQRARPLPELKPGDPVLVADGPRRKLARVQSRADQPRSYFVTDHTDKRIRRNRRHLIKLEPDSPADNSNTVDKILSDDEAWSSAGSETSPSPDKTGSAPDHEPNLEPERHKGNSREPRQAAVKARVNMKNYV